MCACVHECHESLSHLPFGLASYSLHHNSIYKVWGGEVWSGAVWGGEVWSGGVGGEVWGKRWRGVGERCGVEGVERRGVG